MLIILLVILVVPALIAFLLNEIRNIKNKKVLLLELIKDDDVSIRKEHDDTEIDPQE